MSKFTNHTGMRQTWVCCLNPVRCFKIKLHVRKRRTEHILQPWCHLIILVWPSAACAIIPKKFSWWSISGAPNVHLYPLWTWTQYLFVEMGYLDALTFQFRQPFNLVYSTRVELKVENGFLLIWDYSSSPQEHWWSYGCIYAAFIVVVFPWIGL